MAGATQPKRRVLQNCPLVWWDKYVINEYPARTYSETSLKTFSTTEITLSTMIDPDWVIVASCLSSFFSLLPSPTACQLTGPHHSRKRWNVLPNLLLASSVKEGNDTKYRTDGFYMISKVTELVKIHANISSVAFQLEGVNTERKKKTRRWCGFPAKARHFRERVVCSRQLHIGLAMGTTCKSW